MGGIQERAGRRVVVTGLGAVSPFGYGVDVLWSGLCRNVSAIRPFDVFDPARHRTQIAGQVGTEGESGWGDLSRTLRPREISRLTRTDRFALGAALEALANAELDVRAIEENVGVFIGSSTGGMLEAEAFVEGVCEGRGGPWRPSALASQQNNGPVDAIARTLGTWGPTETIASACAAATMSIGSALAAIRCGEIDVAIAGGSDGLCQLTYAGFNSLRAVDEAPSRPFRASRAGLSLGEGAGVFVLESLEHALSRRAIPLVELEGTADACDAYHMTAPAPDGSGAALAISGALRNAGLTPGDVDLINAHGTGTPLNDASEWAAMRTLFGERAGSIPLTSTKGAIGHSLGACGGVEGVVTACCLIERRVHPTPGEGPVDPECRADLVLNEPRELERTRAAVSVNLAFGGAAAALVLGREGEVFA